jgi:4-hydroxybenzoate polyprenyltransferase
MIYATQDEEIDRSQGLHSAIVRLGRNRGLLLARFCHALMIPCLFLFFWVSVELHVFFLVAMAAISVLLIYQHYLVSPQKIAQNPQQELQKINFAFFRVNGIISITLLVATGLDLL